MMKDETVQDRIKQKLDELNLSMKGASRDAGLGETAIRDILQRANHVPKTSTLEKLAPILQTTVEWLIFGETAKDREYQDAQIIDIWSRIPMEKRPIYKEVLEQAARDGNEAG